MQNCGEKHPQRAIIGLAWLDAQLKRLVVVITI